MESHGNGVVDFGRFLTGFFVVMGVGKSYAGAKMDTLESGGMSDMKQTPRHMRQPDTAQKLTSC
jgi:hypothetical protein